MSDPLAYVIALYIRLSIEDAKVESLSIENQKTALHKYVDTMDGPRNTEVLEFIDNGYSGTNFERPSVQELLDAVRSGKVKCIIVKDFSRFGRNSIEVGYFMERVFPLYGVRFISINDNFDSATLHGDTGGINVAFKYLVSEFYSRDLSVKTMTSKSIKMKRGEYQSVICPYGYRKSEDGRMELDDETAPVVRWIFELALEGKKAPQIAEALSAKGIPTPGEYKTAKGIHRFDVSRAGGLWQPCSVMRILRDERFAGTYIIGKRKVTEVGSTHYRLRDESEWIKIPDHHPAIVTKEQFDLIQATFPRQRQKAKEKSRSYSLRDKVYCGCCLHRMTREETHTSYFFCRFTKTSKNALCHGLHILESDLESPLFAIINKQAQVIMNKKGRLKDTKGDTSADDDTYNTIMRDKEWLLSFARPLRFIFSHSALKEGWDNPNVFQVCTLIEQKSVFTCRQKVGRGLRLCVNQDGECVEDKNINVLHVMANESFAEFAETLQKEIEDDTGIKFGVLQYSLFAGMVYEDKHEEEKTISPEQAVQIVEELKTIGLIDAAGTVRQAALPEEASLSEHTEEAKAVVAEALQNGAVTLTALTGKTYTVTVTEEKVIEDADARELIQHFERKGYISGTGKIKDTMKAALKTGTLDLPKKYEAAKSRIAQIVAKADRRPPIRDASRDVTV